MWHKIKFKSLKHIVGNAFIGVIEEYCNSTNINPIPVVIFKIDYEKTYDFVSWDFLYYMMSRLGFCDR